MKIAQRLSEIPASPTLAISAKAKAMKAEGIDVVSFGAGEPDFATPAAICEAAAEAARVGPHGYTAVPGTIELRKAIAQSTARRTGFTHDPEEIIASCGAKHTLYNLFLATLDPGDEILIPAPYWVSYPVMATMAGATPRFVTGPADRGFAPDMETLEAATTENTRAIVINNPSNPTGMLWDKAALNEVGEWLLRHPEIAVFSDAIYDELTYDNEPCIELLSLFPDLRSRYIHVNGISKSFAMTGWRLGWACGPQSVIKAMTKLQSQSTSNPNAMTQVAAIKALELGDEVIRPMRAAFQDRRDLIGSLLRAIPGVELPEPKGAFYAFPNFSAYIGKQFGGTQFTDDMELTAWLLEEARVAVVPGSAFGAPGHLRLSYASSPESIREGVTRIHQALDTLTSSNA